MATICDNPYSIPTIDLDECIGTSLATINSNFQELKGIDCLTYDETERIQTSLIDLSSQFFSLSSFAPGFAKAYVGFSVSGSTPTIQSTLNVARVSALSTGTFALSFTTAFPGVSNYALVGTCKETLTGSQYVWVQPTTFTATSASINIRSQDGTLTNPEYVSILIFNN